MAYMNRDQVQHLAQGRWMREVYPRLGVPDELLGKQHNDCPFCNREADFRFSNRNGRGGWICVCGNGDGLDFIQRYLGLLSFNDAKDVVVELLGGNNLPAYIPPLRAEKAEKPQAEMDERQYSEICNEFFKAVPVTAGDPVWKYLFPTRGLTEVDLSPDAIRYLAKTQHRPYGAMVAAFSNANEEHVQTHRTFLTEDGQKAPIDKPKRFMASCMDGIMDGGSVKLVEHTGDILAVAEGIETALAVRELTNYQYPVFATCSEVFMKKLKVPDTVRTVLIYADNDENEVGQRAANVLRECMIALGKKVEIMLPAKPGTDFADELKGRSNHD